MTETPELTATNSVDAQELAEAIAELEQYRERLLNDTVETAKKAKLTKSSVMAQLEPQLAQIDAMLENLRQQQANLTANN
jgi:capsule polysaccharide export protein KpsE/RkpR